MDTFGKIYIAVSLVLLVAMIFIFSVISRRAPKGTLLAVGVGLWLIGQAISGVPVREIRGLSGLCILSGFIGGLLGIFDLIRKKNDPEPSAPPPLPPKNEEKS
jgi:hypothetical protein